MNKLIAVASLALTLASSVTGCWATSGSSSSSSTTTPRKEMRGYGAPCKDSSWCPGILMCSDGTCG